MYILNKYRSRLHHSPFPQPLLSRRSYSIFCFALKMSINRDLHVELEEACRRSTLDRGELRQKLRDFEALALERLTTVHRLEAQVQ